MPGLTKNRRKELQAVVDSDFNYRSYWDDDVEVKRTGKCGYGLFAVRQFLPGELVMEVQGQLISKKKYEGSEYVMDLDDDWYLEPSSPGAFMNHSCSPNCELIQLTETSLGVVAICNVEPESEITFDYAWEAFDWNPRCRCGARNCRGWVVASDEVKKMKRLAKSMKAKADKSSAKKKPR